MPASIEHIQRVLAFQEGKMPKHTPGPWESSATGIWAKSPWNARVKIATITTFSLMNGIDWNANANLIVAAPELLAELRTAVQHIEHMGAWIGKQNAGYSFESLGEDMPGMRAAIAKADGR